MNDIAIEVKETVPSKTCVIGTLQSQLMKIETFSRLDLAR